MFKYWEIDEGKVDSGVFFRTLAKHFPHATTFFAEGTSIADDVQEFFQSHSENGDFLPRKQTLFPRSDGYRCSFSSTFADGLAALAEQHAEPELLDHLSLYKGDTPILEWHDAFANIMLIPRTVSERIVSLFARELGLEYREV